MTHTSFTPEGFQAFRANNRPGPVQMLNLVKFRAEAAYEDGTGATGVTGANGATGAEAYAAYSRLSGPVFARFGGRIIWSGQMEQMMIGPSGESWDLCFIAQYPSPEAFVAMISDPEYRAAMPHRQAAVEDSRLVRMMPQPAGDMFG